MSFLNKLEERETFGFVIDSYSFTVILELFFWISEYPAAWLLPSDYFIFICEDKRIYAIDYI